MECRRVRAENQELRQREAQMVELINRHKTVTMGSLREACHRFEDFIPFELGGHLSSTNQGIN